MSSNYKTIRSENDKLRSQTESFRRDYRIMMTKYNDLFEKFIDTVNDIERNKIFHTIEHNVLIVFAILMYRFVFHGGVGWNAADNRMSGCVIFLIIGSCYVRYAPEKYNLLVKLADRVFRVKEKLKNWNSERQDRK